MAVKFKSSININDQYTLPSTVGLTGQYLKVNDAATGELIFADLGEAAQVSTIAYEVRNETGVSIPKGSAVYISGGSGSSDHVLISLASASTEDSSSKTFGITAETIANNSTGDVVLEGIIEGIDTSGFTAGGTLWLGETPGSIQAAPPPSTPSHAVFVGYAVRIQQNSGSMFVKIQNGYELEELHDVLIDNVQDGQGLVWDAANSYWKNVELASGGGELKVLRDNFTGDGIETTFTLSAAITTESQTQVYLDGVYQSKDNYTTSGSNVIFTTPIPNGAGLEIIHIVSLSANVDTETFTGDGSTVAYALSKNINDENNTQVYFDGVYQLKGSYSILGNTITFAAAPPLDVAIEVVYFSNLNTAQAGNYEVQVISANTAALKATVYVLTASLTLTLPIAPELGDSIKISNLSDVDTCIIARNGNNIMGLAEDLTLDSASASFELIYANTTKGWVIIAQ